MASFLSLERQTISSYETGRTEPNYDTLVEIADMLDVSLDYLLGRTKKEKNPYLIDDCKETDILDAINSLLKEETRKNQEIIFNIIKLINSYKEE